MSVNPNTLAKVFNTELKEIKSNLKDLKNSPDPIKILTDNIEKTQLIQEKILELIINGSISDKLASAAASIANSITQAVNSLASMYMFDENLQLKVENLRLKEEELKLKIKESSKPTNQTNVLVVGSREEILKVINNKSNLLDN